MAHLIALHERPTRRWWIGAAAAAALVVALGVWWLAAARLTAPDSTETPATIRATLDLRPHSATRRPGASDVRPPLELPRGRVELTLLLPVGSEPGLYDIQLLDAEQHSLVSTRGEAMIRDFVTTLRASLNLSEVTSGDYRLAVRRTGDGWRHYPAIVRQK